MKKLLLKICGMREAANIRSVLALEPDMMGFIFYEKSTRNAENELEEELLIYFPIGTQKVGVFVNADINFVAEKIRKYKLQLVQLHGSESPVYCNEIKKLGVDIIKAFSIDESFDFDSLEQYNGIASLLLFDTKGKNAGGNGIKFDWDLLNNIKIKQPFLISGGVDIEDVEAVVAFQKLHPQLIGIDVNSKFELKPALKDVNKLQSLQKKLHETL
jgi:phosphoribosylanthranilate isomerase